MNEFWKDIAIPNLTSLSGYLEIWLTLSLRICSLLRTLKSSKGNSSEQWLGLKT